MTMLATSLDYVNANPWEMLGCVALLVAVFLPVFAFALALESHDRATAERRDHERSKRNAVHGDALRRAAIRDMKAALTAEDAAFLRRDRTAESLAHEAYEDARERYRDTFR